MSASKKSDLANLMWTEKYRPKKLGEVVGQKEILKAIGNLIKSPDLPHLLFSGPAGVGKTTAALCIATELLGEDWRKNTLSLNASDERGIKMVRERVKEFAASIK
ncbi:MAG: AAA family ATPase, partial [Nitrososphaera sp.]